MSEDVGKKRLVACLAVMAVAMLWHLFVADIFDGGSLMQKAERVQEAVSTHERQMQEMLDDLTKEADRYDLRSALNHADEEQRYSLYAFRGEELAAWHNALLPIDDITPDDLAPRIVKADNGWYLTCRQAKGDLQFFALLRLRQQYYFDNQYLRAAYHESLGIDASNQLVVDPSAEGLQIDDLDGQYLFTIVESSSTQSSTSSTIWSLLTFVVWLIAAISAVFIYNGLLLARGSRKRTALPKIAAWLVATYFLSLCFTIPTRYEKTFLFSSQEFAYNLILPSIAFLLEIALSILVFCICAYRYDWSYRPLVKNLSASKTIYCVAMLVVVYAMFMLVNWGLVFLVKHSNGLLLFVDSIDISPTFVTKLLIVALMIFSLIMIMEKAYTEICEMSIHTHNFHLILLAFTLVVIVPSSTIHNHGAIFVVGFVVLNAFYFFLKRNRTKWLKFSSFVWVTFVVALFVTLRLTVQNEKKETQNRELLINNLSFQLVRDDDPIAELLLSNVENDIANDILIFKAFARGGRSFDFVSRIFTHMHEVYFDGYFSRYDLQIVPCYSSRTTMELASGERVNCLDYFTSRIQDMGNRIAPLSAFYCMSDNDGRASYVGQFAYFNSRKQDFDQLFIVLTQKDITNEVGYPELLTNERDRLNEQQYKGYSYALYFDGKLATHSGSFDYPLTWRDDSPGFTYRTVQNDFSHLVSHASRRQTVVLSYPTLTATQFIANYSIIFLTSFVLGLLLLFFGRSQNNFVFGSLTIQERIQLSFVLFVMVLFIAIAVVTSMQSVDNYENETRLRMTKTMTSVQRFIEHENVPLSSANLDNLLQRTGALFDVDVNIFSPEGRLIGSSRRELFRNGIAAPLINSLALEGICQDGERELFFTESIGELTHYTIYAPLLDPDDKILGIVGMPYFHDVDAVRRQLVSTFLPITYAYLLIILLSILFSYLLTSGITQPLMRIRDSIRKIGLQKKNEKISYPNEIDEIGLLVKEYNRMIDELANSANLLSISERESTWREMARQIAHEIKNPLTPMKLNVQYMLRAWDEQRDDFGTFIHRVAQTLVEQIDHLAYVASEFSNIAKMPNEAPERVDVVERLANCVMLFGKSENAIVTLEKHVDQAFAMINGEQLTSVFNNLIKNALQSVSEGEEIEIRTSVEVVDSTIRISVSDNGHGIDPEVREKIFRPNFTTKSTGMGLGLAICKTLITNAHGDIWFETETEKGTTFFISLPLC